MREDAAPESFVLPLGLVPLGSLENAPPTLRPSARRRDGRLVALVALGVSAAGIVATIIATRPQVAPPPAQEDVRAPVVRTPTAPTASPVASAPESPAVAPSAPAAGRAGRLPRPTAPPALSSSPECAATPKRPCGHCPEGDLFCWMRCEANAPR
jgi:hypothetical protein